jgi:hypothetical protein
MISKKTDNIKRCITRVWFQAPFSKKNYLKHKIKYTVFPDSFSKAALRRPPENQARERYKQWFELTPKQIINLKAL